MNKKFNKNLALIALVSAITLGGSPALADSNSGNNNGKKNGSAIGWKLPTGAKMFAGKVMAINDNQITLAHNKATSSPLFTVKLSDETTYLGGKSADISIGTRLSGIGIKQSDGTYSAQTIRINPAMKAALAKRQNAAGLRHFAGTIVKSDGSSIVVKEKKASSTVEVTVKLLGSTVYATGTISDLTVGSLVAGVGTINSDKSITALKIHPGTSKIGIFHRGKRKING